MKSEISPKLIAAIGVVVVLVIGLVAYKVFGGNPAASSATPQQINEVKQMRSSIMAPGVHRDENGHFVDAQGNPVNMVPNLKGK
jgi:hypothetical protein